MTDNTAPPSDKPKGVQQYFPPPPPGPPPAQSQHTHDASYNPPAGPPPLQQQPAYGAPQTADLTQTQFPPPPPGPPPAQSQYTHDASYNPPPGPPPPQQQPSYGTPQAASQTQPQFPPPPQQHPDEVPLPDYNPANYPGSHPAGAASNAPPTEPELTSDEKRHAKAKAWSAKMHLLGAKAAAPINAFANKMGSQAFLPSTMDKECEKAAAILTSFCKDGAHGHGQRPVTPTDESKKDKKRSRSRDRAILRIPSKVLHNAVGLAIFTTARIGFQFSAATGSGILIARLPDGSWSPPSAIQVHTLGAGFMAGVDIYDCVCVINSREALEAFMHTRVSLGSSVAVTAGPFGAGGKVDIGAGSGGHEGGDGHSGYGKEKPAEAAAPEAHPPTVVEPAQQGQPAAGVAPGAPTDPTKLTPDGKERPASSHRRTASSFKSLAPVFTYIKSRGLWAGIQADGTVITERKEANHAFYCQKVTVERILRAEGLVPQESPHLWPKATAVLLDALKKAEARKEEGEEVIVPPAAATPAVAAPAVANPPAPAGPSAAVAGAPPSVQHEHVGYYKAEEAGPSTSGAARTEELPAYQEPAVPYPGTGDQKGATYY